MVKVWQITLLLSLLSSMAVSCSNPFNSLNKHDIELTPEDYKEAELIALCLSGELAAPDNLYDQVLNDLAVIRSTYGDRFEPIKRIKFKPPWVVGCIIVGFDSTTAQKVANGDYHAWDYLNEKYQVTEIDTGITNAAVLHFKNRLHPRRLAELYMVLPGVRYAEPNGIGGDFSNVYPRQDWSGITYLFREGWGDCPSGCINNKYWYFVAEWNRPILIGYWVPHENPREPSWWNEAQKNIKQFYRW